MVFDQALDWRKDGDSSRENATGILRSRIIELDIELSGEVEEDDH